MSGKILKIVSARVLVSFTLETDMPNFFVVEIGTCEDYDFYVLYGPDIKQAKRIARCQSESIANKICDMMKAVGLSFGELREMDWHDYSKL